MKCEGCRYLMCDEGDRWTPTTFYCELDLDEDDCEEYIEEEYVNEEWERHDYQLRDYEYWKVKAGEDD